MDVVMYEGISLITESKNELKKYHVPSPAFRWEFSVTNYKDEKIYMTGGERKIWGGGGPK